jgi:Tfp pilus assembly protein PilF/peroxiredoxin
VVTVNAEGRSQSRTLRAASGFLSQHSKDLFFGLSGAKGPVDASVRWPSGLVQQFQHLPINHRITLEEGSATPEIEVFKPVSATSSHHGDRNSAEGEYPSQAPELLPSVVETWLLSPVPAPDFSLPDLAGRLQTLSALRGKPALLNFWVSESADCKKVLRDFGQFYSQWTANGLQLLTVNVDDQANGPRGGPSTSLQKLAADHKLPFVVLRGSEETGAVYNILYRYLFDRHRDLGLPTSFLINRSGEIVKVYQGMVDCDHIDRDFRNIPATNAERIALALPFPGIVSATDFARNYLSYGSIFFQRGYYAQAGESFARAVHDDPNSAEALYGLGSVYLQEEKTELAQAAFERAVKMQPQYPDTLPNAWNNLGLLATRQGHTDAAIPYFQQALKLRPDYLIALENLGNAYRQQKKWDDARRVLERAVAVGPDDPEVNYSLGMVFAQLDDADQAFDYLQRSLKLRPVYPEALNNLGVLYMRTNREEQAVQTFEQCIRVAPAFDQSYLNLARVYALQNDPAKARGVLLALLKQHPGHAQATALMQELGH